MNLADLGSDELMVLAKNGVPHAFETLLARHRPGVLRAARRRLGSMEQAKDVAQNTFIDLLRCLDRYEPRGKFDAFLSKLVINQCRMEHRSSGRASKLISGLIGVEPPEQSLPDRIAMEREHRSLLRRQIESLSPKLATVMRLRLANLSYEEIASVLGLRLGTVKSRLFVAVRCLRHSSR